MNPPFAKIIPKKLKKHNHTRIDNYFWLNNRENPEVIDYLTQENDYYKSMTAHTKDFQNKLYEEMKARINEDDSSVPYFYNGYYYLTKFEKTKIILFTFVEKRPLQRLMKFYLIVIF